jgi:hypothetical protein
MSFHDVAITVRAVNEATATFETVSVDAARMGADVAGATREMTSSFEMAGEEAEEMAERIEVSGAAVREATRDLTTLGTGITAVARLSEQFGVLNKEQAGWMRTIGMSLTAVSGVVRSIQVLSSVTSVATAVQNALNISHATFLALTGVGIGVIIAAAAAMAYFASQMNAATSSVERYNAATSGMPTHTRSIRRAGGEDLRRRGIE